MKRLLMFLLVFVVLTSCSGCERGSADPVLVSAVDVLPAGMWSVGLMDEEHLLAGSLDTEKYSIVNLSTGEIVALTTDVLLPYDVMRWESLVSGCKPMVGGNQYALLGTSGSGVVVNRKTGKSHTVSFDSNTFGITPWDELYRYQTRTNMVSVMDLNGAELATKEFDGYGGKLWVVHPLDDGFLLVFRGSEVHWTGDAVPLRSAYEHTVVFTDKMLNVRSSEELGAFDCLRGEQEACFQLPGRNELLLVISGNMILYDRTDREHEVFISTNGNAGFVPYQNTEEMLNSLVDVADHASSSQVAGVAKDGSYALFVLGMDCSLYMIDFGSMKVTRQMSGEELEHLGVDNPLRLFWPGGDYLSDGTDVILRIVDRHEQMR